MNAILRTRVVTEELLRYGQRKTYLVGSENPTAYVTEVHAVGRKDVISSR